MGCCMNDSEIGSKRIYRQPINYENGIILPLIRDCCIARAGNPKSFQINVQTFALILPKELRVKAFVLNGRGNWYSEFERRSR